MTQPNAVCPMCHCVAAFTGTLAGIPWYRCEDCGHETHPQPAAEPLPEPVVQFALSLQIGGFRLASGQIILAEEMQSSCRA